MKNWKTWIFFTNAWSRSLVWSNLRSRKQPQVRTEIPLATDCSVPSVPSMQMTQMTPWPCPDKRFSGHSKHLNFHRCMAFGDLVALDDLAGYSITRRSKCQRAMATKNIRLMQCRSILRPRFKSIWKYTEHLAEKASWEPHQLLWHRRPRWRNVRLKENDKQNPTTDGSHIRISTKRPKFLQESWMYLCIFVLQGWDEACSSHLPACDFEALTCINAWASEAKTKLLSSSHEFFQLYVKYSYFPPEKELKTKTSSPDSLTTQRCLVHSVAESHLCQCIETRGKSRNLIHNFAYDSLVMIRMVFACLFATFHFPILFVLFPLAATRCNMATRSAKTGTAKSVFGCNGKSATKWAVPWNSATETMAPTASLNVYRTWRPSAYW